MAMNSVTKGKLISYVVAIFLAGVGTGTFMGYHFGAEARKAQRRNNLMVNTNLQSLIQERFESELALTPEQRAKIEPIWAKTGDSLQEAHRQSLEKIQSILTAANAEIEPILNEKQCEKLSNMERKRREFMDKTCPKKTNSQATAQSPTDETR